MEQSYLLVLCTCPDAETAQTIAHALVDRRLAACVNVVGDLTSVYRWQGNVESDQEHLLLVKTTAASYGQLEALVQQLHPYEVPEIIALPVARGLPAYLAWIESSTGR